MSRRTATISSGVGARIDTGKHREWIGGMSFEGCRVPMMNCVASWWRSITRQRLLEVLADGFGVVQQDGVVLPGDRRVARGLLEHVVDEVGLRGVPAALRGDERREAGSSLTSFFVMPKKSATFNSTRSLSGSACASSASARTAAVFPAPSGPYTTRLTGSSTASWRRSRTSACGMSASDGACVSIQSGSSISTG